MFDPIQWVLAVVDAIVRLSIEAKKESRDHVKTASVGGTGKLSPVVWRSVPVPDV